MSALDVRGILKAQGPATVAIPTAEPTVPGGGDGLTSRNIEIESLENARLGFSPWGLEHTQAEAFGLQELESLRLLTAGVAHDLSNLLGCISAEMELAESDLASGFSADEEVRKVKVLAIRAAEIARGFMIYSGQETANIEPLDISRLAEEMLALFQCYVGRRTVLKVDLQPYLPAVQGNATQIRRVVMNLIKNAAEAIGDNAGLIRVSTSLLPGEPGNPSKCDYIRLEIADSGCGLTDEAKARVFNPFFTTKVAGHGLGLAVVHAIVRAHGGAIHVSSTRGQGTTFQIHLPCANNRLERSVV